MKLFFILMFFCALMYLPNLMAANVTVSGVCQKKVTPDRIAVVITAQHTAKDPSVASEKVNAQYEKLKGAVKKLKLNDLELETSTYSVSPDWDYSVQNKPTLKGYTAQMGLRIETSELQRMGEILALAADLDFANINTPQTSLSIPLFETETQNCLAIAVKQAEQKARKMADAIGMQINNLLNLQENSGNTIPMMQENSMLMAGDVVNARSAFKAPQIEIRSEIISASVMAQYELK